MNKAEYEKMATNGFKNGPLQKSKFRFDFLLIVQRFAMRASLKQ